MPHYLIKYRHRDMPDEVLEGAALAPDPDAVTSFLVQTLADVAWQVHCQLGKPCPISRGDMEEEVRRSLEILAVREVKDE